MRINIASTCSMETGLRPLAAGLRHLYAAVAVVERRADSGAQREGRWISRTGNGIDVHAFGEGPR